MLATDCHDFTITSRNIKEEKEYIQNLRCQSNLTPSLIMMSSICGHSTCSPCTCMTCDNASGAVYCLVEQKTICRTCSPQGINFQSDLRLGCNDCQRYTKTCTGCCEMRNRVQKMRKAYVDCQISNNIQHLVAYVCTTELKWAIFGGYVRDYLIAGVRANDIDVYIPKTMSPRQAFNHLIKAIQQLRAIVWFLPTRMNPHWKIMHKTTGQSVELDLIYPTEDFTAHVDANINNLIMDSTGIRKRCELQDSIPAIITSIRLGNFIATLCAVLTLFNREKKCVLSDFRPAKREYMLEKRLPKLLSRGVLIENLSEWGQKLACLQGRLVGDVICRVRCLAILQIGGSSSTSTGPPN